jgi:hypothetical protein
LIQRYVASVNQWFDINGMICNPTKHQAMVLGNKLHYEFSFPTKDSLDLLGMTIATSFPGLFPFCHWEGGKRPWHRAVVYVF